MPLELSSEERNWVMAAHLCGLLWLAGVQISDGKAYRHPFCLRLVK